MNREDIIKLAREAGLLHESDTAEIISECGVEVWLSPSDGVSTLERFAALVAAAEREESVAWEKQLSKELLGVIADVEEGDGFDDVCLDTIKYVHEQLAIRAKGNK